MSSGKLILFFLFLSLPFLEYLSYSNILPEHKEPGRCCSPAHPFGNPVKLDRRCQPFSSNVTVHALSCPVSQCFLGLGIKSQDFSVRGVTKLYQETGRRRGSSPSIEGGTLYPSRLCVYMTNHPLQKTSNSTYDNDRHQAGPPKRVMTLTNLSEGESTLIISAKKGDEESGEFSATTASTGALSRKTQTTEKSDEFPIDGGFEGWTCVIGGWFALFATFGWLNS